MDYVFEPLHARVDFTLEGSVLMTRVLTRTVTYLTVCRVTLS
jgi:hypothetical protein